MMAVFVLDPMPVNNMFQNVLSNNIVAKKSRIMIWGVISYHEWSKLLGIEDNLNSKRYVLEALQSEVVPFFQDIFQ